jgi:hypothetical protein
VTIALAESLAEGGGGFLARLKVGCIERELKHFLWLKGLTWTSTAPRRRMGFDGIQNAQAVGGSGVTSESG